MLLWCSVRAMGICGLILISRDCSHTTTVLGLLNLQIQISICDISWYRLFSCFHFDGLMQHCSNSSMLSVELLQSCTKLSIWIKKNGVKVCLFHDVNIAEMYNEVLLLYSPNKHDTTCCYYKGETLIIFWTKTIHTSFPTGEWWSLLWITLIVLWDAIVIPCERLDRYYWLYNMQVEYFWSLYQR